jgi:hypothetical protein
MSQAQFDKAVAIVKALPPNGSVKPTQDDQLAVSFGLLDTIPIRSGVFVTRVVYCGLVVVGSEGAWEMSDATELK